MKSHRKPVRTSTRGKYDRNTSSRERQRQQYEALLAAATTELAQHGFADTAVEAIVSRAQMSRRTFYEHFDDLRDVLHQIHDRAATLAFGVITAQIQMSDEPLERIRTGIAAYLGAIAANPEVARVVFVVVRSAGPEFETRHDIETQRYAELMLEMLKEAHRRGQLSGPPDPTMAYALTAGIEAIGLRQITKKDLRPTRESAEALVTMAFRAFGVIGAS
jgi:AcrR family transcriptional regulator